VKQALPYVLAVGVTGAVCFFGVEPIGRDDSHFWRMVLAGVSIGLLWILWWVRRNNADGRALTAVRVALVAACTMGWFNYFQFDRDVLLGINDYTDSSYYYTNSKYLKELSYTGLYSSALLCDRERGSPRTKEIRQVRDLRDYELVSVPQALRHGEQVKADFSAARWAAYCHDITFFMDRLSRKALRTNWFVDHGYNPPPTWSLLGGNLATLLPVEHLKAACSVDAVLVLAMFIAIAWAFGVDVTLLAMLFWVTTFSGRWPILGQAILRFDWVVALVAAVAFLKKDRPASAGAAFAFAACNRVFPAIFFLGWGLTFLFDLVQERRVSRRHARFLTAAAVVTVMMSGAALLQYGPDTLRRSAENLRMHNETYSSHRVGLGDVLVYRGERDRDDIRASCMELDHGTECGIYGKELKIRTWQWRLRFAGLLAIGFVGLYAWRTREADWELIGLAVLPFFCMTNPQINYYNLRVLLFMWHGAHLDKPAHRGLMSLLLLVEVATQATKVVGVERYLTTTTTSYGMLLYLVVLCAWMVRRMLR